MTTPIMDEERPAEIDLPLATGWARRREGQAQDYYVVESQLGEGGCGSVFGAKRISDGLSVALKVVEKTEWDQFGTPWEVQVMSQVNHNTGHPNILRLFEWFDAPDFYVLVLERPEPCRDLSDFCTPQNKLDEQQARGVIQQLLDALLHCQHSGVFHRDLKPANVLMNTDSNRVTLIDFGLGTPWTNTPYTFAGTRAFTAPEWFRSGEYQAGPGTVWSLGVTLFNIVCGYLPYDPREDPDTMGIIFYPEELSPPLVDFMERCLAPEVELRASLEELRDHLWLRPSCIQSGTKEDQDPEEAVTHELFRQMRSILDQLTPGKFEQLLEQIKGLTINTEARLEGIVEMVLEKAICEEKFAGTYAKMCCELKELTVPCSDPALPLSFQSLMLDLCQKEALKVTCDGVVLQKEWRDQRAGKGEDGQTLQQLEAKVTAHRKRAVGSMMLFGELHKHGMVKDRVILECIAQFLDTKTAEALECLCCLITAADSILHSEELKAEMDGHFCQIESILRERTLTARVCFMLRDLLELRQVHTREMKRITEALPISEDVKLREAEDPWHHGQHHDQVRHLRLNDGEHQGHNQDQRWHHGKRQGHPQDQRWYHGECQGHAQKRRQHQGERYHQGQQGGLRHEKRQDHCQDRRRNHEEHQGRAQNQRWYHREHEGCAPDQTRYHREYQGHAQRQRRHHGEHEGRAQHQKWHHGEHHGHVQNQRPYHGQFQGCA